MTKKEFNPNLASEEDSGIFGLPYTVEESKVIFLPVPWEATTSYGSGTSLGPKAILEASKQLDLYDIELDKPYEAGLCMLPINKEIADLNHDAKRHAQRIIHRGYASSEHTDHFADLNNVNRMSEIMNRWVKSKTSELLDAGKIVALIGGDHSTPYGCLQAYAEKYSEFGILHFDAHSDTRKEYEGFRHSHASIMYNVMTTIPQVKKLVQVGIRDFCEDENNFIKSQGNRMAVFYDHDLAIRKMNSESWQKISQEIVHTLPNQIYISFDIDGLDPRFCPHTGTPVAGGLDFHEAVHLIREVVKSGRRIIGFDLNEVAPGEDHGEWDANVAMRLLYKMTGFTLASQGLIKFKS